MLAPVPAKGLGFTGYGIFKSLSCQSLNWSGNLSLNFLLNSKRLDYKNSMHASRTPALFTVLLFVLLELVANPFTSLAIADDWSYLQTAKVLAQTGHIAYNGWATAMLGWQLYPAALVIRLFGFTHTGPRLTVMALAAATVYLTQRLFVRVGIGSPNDQRNAVIATLTLALQPLFMELSATFMTDIPGLFVLILCLSFCVRAVQASTPALASRWLLVAIVSNALLGTVRQVAWLGLLVMVPSALWLLRRNRRQLAAPVAVLAAGVAFVLLSMRWFAHQPYSITEKITPPIHGLPTLFYMARQFTRGWLELPLLVLPVLIAFIAPGFRLVRSHRLAPMILTALATSMAAYFFVALQLIQHHSPGSLLQPMLGDWLGPRAWYDSSGLATEAALVLTNPLRAALTLLTLTATYAFAAFLLSPKRSLKNSDAPSFRASSARVGSAPESSLSPLSWPDLLTLTLPFTAAYALLLLPRTTTNLIDRYLLPLELILLLLATRAYQHFLRPTLPRASVLALAVVACFSTAGLHDMFAFYRARARLAAEVSANKIEATALDGGFEFNAPTELERSPTINDPRINPHTAFHPVPVLANPQSCDARPLTTADYPHFAPFYGLAFTPVACAGPAPFPAATFPRWLRFRRETLYIVRYQPVIQPIIQSAADTPQPTGNAQPTGVLSNP